VHDGVRRYAEIRAVLTTAVPVWPLGLPGFADPWLSLALRAGDITYLAVWRRPGADPAVRLDLPHLRDRPVRVDVLYPRRLPAWTCDWSPGTGSLTVAAGGPEPAARIFRLVAGVGTGVHSPEEEG
jgi:alpha-galactosidase